MPAQLGAFLEHRHAVPHEREGKYAQVSPLGPPPMTATVRARVHAARQMPPGRLASGRPRTS